ncbi:MAG: TerB family tellurite resistance protein [Muribaculaceae bacterium]
MKTKLNSLAALLSAAVWADGEYVEAEKEAVAEVADALEIAPEELEAAVSTEVSKISGMDEEALSEYLLDAGEAVDESEAGIVFEALLQVVLADSELSRSEVSTLLSVAEAIGIEAEDAVLMLADMVKTEEDIEIDFED